MAKAREAQVPRQIAADRAVSPTSPDSAPMTARWLERGLLWMVPHMEPEELDELVECWDCGETVSPSEDSVFLFGDRAVLCLKCAIRRGGAYDAIGERWTR